ncbi:MAG: tRNA preQ1(34) S-adenosylmethionine ribosyltransferase-isomerase QueA [Proteobacteria bacterium]|nr:tRNA preQ1(34) S-adenosylmethionine ribosyltransferase-isomerase QueA [Pseudomonadota bacterium]
MNIDHLLSAYNYHLPPELIAQRPPDKRDESRLMVVDKMNDTLAHHRFSDLAGFIGAKDMIVVNNTRVFPARLLGRKQTGGKAEVFLLEYPAIEDKAKGTARATALIKSSKRPKPGTKITINQNLHCHIIVDLGDGKVELRLHYDSTIGIAETLKTCGQVPLPPYITRAEGCTAEDVNRYQTVYASLPGAVAAPTAGLHFTEQLLKSIRSKGALVGQVTLHVGYGTFAPVREEDITCHLIHEEYFSITEETVKAVLETKKRGGKIWAVGTTTVRALEYAAQVTDSLQPMSGWCNLYIYPGFRFRVIDNLITNFHLPDSSLMFLVSALCDRQTLLNCYQTAIREGYRFFSYGDAMAIIGGQKE